VSISKHNNLVEHNGHWLMALKVQSIDITNKDEDGQIATLQVFQNILKSLPSETQSIFRKVPLDFSEQVEKIESNIQLSPHKKIKEYGEVYVDYLEEVSKSKLDKVNYLILKTQTRVSYEEGEHYLRGIATTIIKAFQNLNMKVSQVVGEELDNLYAIPDFIKEEKDYFVFGGDYRRTYVIKDYPRTAFPNWLKPVLDFPYPIELTQHFHPIARSTVMQQLEMNVAKIQSTIRLQEEHGDVVSSELLTRLHDTEDLLRRLACGSDLIINTSFYITVSARDTEILKYRSYELESYMRQCGLEFRTCRRQVQRGTRSILPLCNDAQLNPYTFDTKSLATILPFTVQDYTEKDGIIYGMNSDMTELISMNLWNMPNPTKIILGKPGFGKSMLAKTETARHIINNVQAIIIDHDYEWKGFCDILGGQYVNETTDNVNWNHHLLVFSGEIKVESLKAVWHQIKSENVKQRVLVIEEFHNILRKEKELMLQVAKEVRKTGTASTLITQNVMDFLRNEEGKSIMDCCSIKVFLHQGENDLQEIERLFNITKAEKNYLSICPIGHGYLYTDLYKTKFKVDYSDREEEILSTNPIQKMRRNNNGDLCDIKK
jgi:hypothetical protein